MPPHLKTEFFRRIEKGEGMGACLGEHLHAACFHKFPVALDNLRGIGLKLVQRRAGNGKTRLEAPLMAFDESEQQGVHGQIALAGHLEQDAAVGVLILIERTLPYVEKGIVAQAVGLMHLKIEADVRHGYLLPAMSRS